MDDGKSEHVRSGVGEAKSEKRVVQGHIRVFLLYSTSRHSNSTRPCVVIVAPTVETTPYTVFARSARGAHGWRKSSTAYAEAWCRGYRTPSSTLQLTEKRILEITIALCSMRHYCHQWQPGAPLLRPIFLFPCLFSLVRPNARSLSCQPAVAVSPDPGSSCAVLRFDNKNIRYHALSLACLITRSLAHYF